MAMNPNLKFLKTNLQTQPSLGYSFQWLQWVLHHDPEFTASHSGKQNLIKITSYSAFYATGIPYEP